jgi:hypothetical protein
VNWSVMLPVWPVYVSAGGSPGPDAGLFIRKSRTKRAVCTEVRLSPVDGAHLIQCWSWPGLQARVERGGFDPPAGKTKRSLK